MDILGGDGFYWVLFLYISHAFLCLSKPKGILVVAAIT